LLEKQRSSAIYLDGKHSVLPAIAITSFFRAASFSLSSFQRSAAASQASLVGKAIGATVTRSLEVTLQLSHPLGIVCGV
jgi:hypothetical protein